MLCIKNEWKTEHAEGWIRDFEQKFDDESLTTKVWTN